MNLFHAEITASLNGVTEGSNVSSVSTMKTLPDKAVNGTFLVVDFTSKTLTIHLVRLQDSDSIPSRNGRNSNRNSKANDTEDSIKSYKDAVRGGSKSKPFDIPTETRSQTGNELFDFIAKSVKDFVGDKEFHGKKYRLVFVFSFPCEYDPDFANARLIKWTRGFDCRGVLNKTLKELLHEAFTRNGVPKTIKVVAVVNGTACTLMSVAHKDPKCKIALSLMDGFWACYQTAHGSQDAQARIITTHLGALGKVSVDKFKSECDRRLDEYTIHTGEQIMEKMTSKLYLGEIVRLKLVELMDKGLLFGSPPHNLTKLLDRNSFTTDDVSLIESDVDFLNTRHVLKKLQVEHGTEEDWKTVRLVCRCVSERAADLAAAGLATLINDLDQADISVAIEGHLQRYHPYFFKHVEKKTRELVNQHLKFTLIPVHEGKSEGAALLGANASPTFPKT